MTPQPCIRLKNGQKGMIIPILLSLMHAANCQRRQDSLIRLADASSHGVANCQTRSLSSRLPSISHGSSAKANHPRIIHSSSNQTRMYKNSLGSATSADVQATKCWSVGLSPSKLAEVTSLKASSCNPPIKWDQKHIIREMSERATREE